MQSKPFCLRTSKIYSFFFCKLGMVIHGWTWYVSEYINSLFPQAIPWHMSPESQSNLSPVNTGWAGQQIWLVSTSCHVADCVILESDLASLGLRGFCF